jgi:hypothetical protein
MVSVVFIARVAAGIIPFLAVAHSSWDAFALQQEFLRGLCPLFCPFFERAD